MLSLAPVLPERPQGRPTQASLTIRKPGAFNGTAEAMLTVTRTADEIARPKPSDASMNSELITTSEIKISVLIDRKYMELAVQALHDTFGLDKAA